MARPSNLTRTAGHFHMPVTAGAVCILLLPTQLCCCLHLVPALLTQVGHWSCWPLRVCWHGWGPALSADAVAV